jgi:hypothetical protein
MLTFSRPGCLTCWVIHGRKLLYTGVKTRRKCGGRGGYTIFIIERRRKVCNYGHFRTVPFSPVGEKRCTWGKELRSGKAKTISGDCSECRITKTVRKGIFGVVSREMAK